MAPRQEDQGGFQIFTWTTEWMVEHLLKLVEGKSREIVSVVGHVELDIPVGHALKDTQ